MNIQTFTNYHLVKNEDLNHHGTLYAGRTAEWFVESGFIAAASLSDPAHTVCLQIHGMVFKRPVQRGDIACFTSRVIYTGTSKLVTHIEMSADDKVVVEGFITFVHVDLEGKTSPHGVQVIPVTPEEQELHQRARDLFPHDEQ